MFLIHSMILLSKVNHWSLDVPSKWNITVTRVACFSQSIVQNQQGMFRRLVVLYDSILNSSHCPGSNEAAIY